MSTKQQGQTAVPAFDIDALANMLAASFASKMPGMTMEDTNACIIVAFRYESREDVKTGRYTFIPVPVDSSAVMGLGGTVKSAQLSSLMAITKEVKRDFQQKAIGLMAFDLERKNACPTADRNTLKEWVQIKNPRVIQDAPTGIVRVTNKSAKALVAALGPEEGEDTEE